MNPQPEPIDSTESLPASTKSEGARPAAWEQLEHGRYKPRRIKGSFLGGELG